MYRSFSQYYQEWQKKWLLAFGFFVWFMPYLMVRFSSENWGAMLFFIAVALIFNQSSISLRKWIFIGFLLAISFFIRFQMVFAIMGLLGYLFYTKRLVISNSWMIVSGALLGLSAMVFLDYLYYDTFVFTPWQYFDQNILQDKAATFGVDPWWMYFGWFFDEARMPISLLIFYGFIRLVKRKELNVMSWVLLPFVLGHFLVGHKELRFLFPMVYLIPFAAAESIYLLSFWKNKLAIRKIVLSALIIMNLGLLLFICFIPAKPFIQVYHQLNTRIEPNAVVFAAAHESSEWNYPLHYYMPQEMIFLPKDSSQSFARINDLPHYVFIKKSQRHEFSLYLGDSICATIPNWMYSMNFNGWVDREKNFLIYRLKE
jgi:phosphatidylinositol glycan class B